MKLVIEGTQAYRRYRGWGRYNELLLLGLHRRASETISSSVYYHEDLSHPPLSGIFSPSPWFRLFPLETSLEQYTRIEENFHQSFIDQHFADCDLYHSVTEFPFFSETVPLVCTIHELTPLIFRDQFPQDRVTEFSRYVGYATKTAVRLICPSSTTKTDLLENFEVEADRIVVIPNGLKPCFKADAVIEDSKDYFLYVGGIKKPSKNFGLLLQAFRNGLSEPDRDFELIVVNSEFDQPSFLKQFAVSEAEAGHIRLLNGVSDQELVHLYQAACALVYPSYHEGFGLPVAEALACACPVLCDERIPVVREWLSDYVVATDTGNVEALAESLRKMRSNRKKHKQEALMNAPKIQETFNLEKFVDSHIDVYRSIL